MITTEHLKIYPATQKQMEAFILAVTDSELKKAYMEMLEKGLQNPSQLNWYAMWQIELKDGTHIGELCFKGLSNDGVAEIGYGIQEAHQRHGYATEAVKAVLAWAFSFKEVTAIEAEVTIENIASQKVLAKCGFIANGQVGEEGPRYICKQLLV